MHDRLTVLKSMGRKLSYLLFLVMVHLVLENWFTFPKWIDSLLNLYIFIFVGYCIIGFYIVLYLRIKYTLSKNTLILHKNNNKVLNKLILLFCGICFSIYGIYLLSDLSSEFFVKVEWLGYMMQFVFFLIFLFGVVLIANAILYFDDLLIIDKEIIYLDSKKGMQLKIKEIEKVEINKVEQESKLSVYYKNGRKTDVLRKFKIKISDQEIFWQKAGIKLKTD